MLAHLAHAQPAVPAPSATQAAASAPAPQPGEPSIAEFEARLRALADARELDEDTRNKATDAYQQAIARWADADAWTAKTVEFRKQRDAVPDQLAEVRRQLERNDAPAASAPVASAPTATMPATELERRLGQLNLEVEATAKAIAGLEEARPERAARRLAIGKEQAELKKKLDELSAELSAPAAAARPTEPGRARLALLVATQRALRAQGEALAAELAYYEASTELVTARLDLLTGQREEFDRRRKQMERAVNDRRADEAKAQAAQAQVRAEEAAVGSLPAIRKLADDNKLLADARARLADDLRSVAQRAEQIAKRLADRQRESTRYRGFVLAASLTDELARALRQLRTRLDDPRALRREYEDRDRRIAEFSLSELEWQDQRDALRDLAGRVNQLLDDGAQRPSAAHREKAARQAQALLTTQRELLDSLIRDAAAYATRLIELNSATRQLEDQTRSFADFIDEHVLWTRSTRPLNWTDLRHAPSAIAERLSMLQPGMAGLALVEDARHRWPQHLLIWPPLAALLWLRPRMRRRVAAIGELTANMRTDSFRLTLEALGLSVLIALIWPGVLGLAGWRLIEAAEYADAVGGIAAATASGESAVAMAFVKQVGAALQWTAAFMFVAGFARILCARQGLGIAHFRWKSRNIDATRRVLGRMIAVISPLIFIQSLVEWQTGDVKAVWMPRFALIGTLIALAAFARKLLNPRGGITENLISRRPNGWLDRLQGIWYPAAVGVPLVLALLSVLGFNYTARELQDRLGFTGGVLLAVLVAYSLLERWFFVAHRRLAYQSALRRREAADAAAPAAAPPAEGERAAAAPIIVDDREVDLSAIHQQVRGLLRTLAAVGVIVGVYLVWVDLLPALGRFTRYSVWNRAQAAAPVAALRPAPGGAMAPDAAAANVASDVLESVTVGDLGTAFLAAVLTLIAARNLPGVLEISVLQRLPLEPSARYAISTVARYAITVFGVVFVFDRLGFAWGQVQWLAAALTVGLGFGLQEIFANFVSGLILLFERPIRLGDTVTIGNVTGVVSRIRTRATTITDWDRKELVIPNKEFITGSVVNWTLTDSVVRLVIPIGLAYGTDTARARAVLLDAARTNRRVLENPAPQAFFMGFGDSVLSFELRVYVGDIDDLQFGRHELNADIDLRLRAAGIEIAFPQRDIHIKAALPLFSAPANVKE